VAAERTVGLDIASPQPPTVVGGAPTAGDRLSSTAVDRARRPWGPVVGERHLGLGVALRDEAAVVACAQPAGGVLTATPDDFAYPPSAWHPPSSTGW
jgi:hypothetical protein